MELVNPDSDVVRLGDLWAEQPVVLVHLRHFGCILCRHFAVKLAAEHPAFEKRGARLVAVGTGGRKYAREFVEERQIRYEMLLDKHTVTHEIIGARSGPPLGIFRPRVVAAAAAAVADGQMQGKTGPHPWIFGAAHVFGVGGEVRYAWLNHDYQDNPPVGELLVAAG